MTNNESIKDLVRQKYSEIAHQDKELNAASCCGASVCSTEVYNIMSDDYSQLEGYLPDADLGLGCGLPTEFAYIKTGDTVVDLGSGAGNDCFIARHEAGDTGHIIGIDFTPAMISKARANAAKLGFANVEFREGDLENIPAATDSVDVVVSNCVLNLVPDKPRVFREIYRILKHGGHFSISDVVLVGELPDALRGAAEMYAGCVAGAAQRDAYLDMIAQTGFEAIAIQKEKEIAIPTDILTHLLDKTQMAAYLNSPSRIISISIYAQKPRTSTYQYEYRENIDEQTKKSTQTTCCSSSCCK